MSIINGFSYKINKQDTATKARTGVIKTPHGDIKTPAFSPVATKAAVRAIGVDDLLNAGSQLVLANTYHLFLQPGTDVIEEFGGFAPFMNWAGPTLTDSGGYQVSFLWENSDSQDRHSELLPAGRHGNSESKSKSVEITDEGAVFKSHLDGSKHLLTPERSMDIQRSLGADIIMAFDQPLKSSKQQAVSSKQLEKDNREAFERSLLWEKRSFEQWQKNEEEKTLLRHSESTNRHPEFQNSHPEFISGSRQQEKQILKLVQNDSLLTPQALFGIIHGGDNEEFIKRSTEMIDDLGFPGLAAGGEFIGSDPSKSEETLELINTYRDMNKPIHALGLGGGPEGIIRAVAQGIDLFDNTSITRMARAGLVFIYPDDGGDATNKFRINLTNAQFKKDHDPISNSCNCYTCQNYSKGYLRHLIKSKEFLGFRLTSVHNIHYIHTLMKDIRGVISEDRFGQLVEKWLG